MAQIGLNRVDLADLAGRLQMADQFGPPYRYADTVIALAERPNHVSPQKAGSAENRDEGIQVRCHRGQLLPVKFERYRWYLADSRYANVAPLYSAIRRH